MHKTSFLQPNWLALKINNNNVFKYSFLYKETVFDLGCGERNFEKHILKSAHKYVGIDWSSTLHKLSADIVADLNKPLPIASNTADTIISLSVLEHLCEPQMMLNEAYRILKVGGIMMVQVPWQWWIHEAPYDYFRFTPYGLKYMFEKAGFDDVTVTAQSGFFTMYIMKINYFTLRFVMGPRMLRFLIKAFLVPFWFLGQIIAPYLDNIDRNWELESTGYVVIAKKADCEPKS
jgi:SAM-dependent methyltransferase